MRSIRNAWRRGSGTPVRLHAPALRVVAQARGGSAAGVRGITAAVAMKLPVQAVADGAAHLQRSTSTRGPAAPRSGRRSGRYPATAQGDRNRPRRVAACESATAWAAWVSRTALRSPVARAEDRRWQSAPAYRPALPARGWGTRSLSAPAEHRWASPECRSAFPRSVKAAAASASGTPPASVRQVAAAWT